MSRALVRRLATAPLVLIAASLLAFLLPQLTGLDPTLAVLRARSVERAPDPAVLDELREELGLDRPVVVRYGAWVADLVTGDLGTSYVSRQPVGPGVRRAVGITGSLTGLSVLGAVSIGIPLGTLAAVRRGRASDRVIASFTQVSLTVPGYVFAPVFILVFAIRLQWLPSFGWGGPDNLVLPSLALALPAAAVVTQLTRTELLEVFREPFMLTARAKGLSEMAATIRHALRNALTAVVSTMSVWTAALLGGAVIIEVIFGIPGLGRTLYAAVLTDDLPVLQAALMAAVAGATLVALATDMLHAAVDPRLRSGDVRA